MSDEQIRERFLGYHSDVMSYEDEDGSHVIGPKLNISPLIVSGMGEVLRVVSDDGLKLSMELINGQLVFNRRLFDINHGSPTSEHVMRSVMMALDIRFLSVR